MCDHILGKKDSYNPLIAILIILILLNVFFFPVIWLGKTFIPLTQVPQVMPEGVYNYEGYKPKLLREFDPGAPVWVLYPAFKLTNYIWFKEHDVALWNPYNGAGIPYIADSEIPIYNLFSLITFLLPSTKTIDIYILLRFFLAGLFMYFFARRMFKSFGVAIFCGIAYMFQGYSILFLNHIPNNVYFMAPLLFLGLSYLLDYANYKSSIILGIIMSFVIFGAFPESSFVVIMVGYFYLLLVVIILRRNYKIILYALLSGIICLLISAIYLFPLYELVKNSFHAHTKEVGLISAGPIKNYFIYFLLPLYRGYFKVHRTLTYFGLIVFTFGIYGLIYFIFKYCRQWIKRNYSFLKIIKNDKLLIIYFLIFILLLSKYSGYKIINWIGKLPFFNIIIYPNYLSPLIAFSIIMVSGYGLKYFFKTRKAKLFSLQILPVIIVAFIILIYTLESKKNNILFKKEVVYFSLIIFAFEILIIFHKKIVNQRILIFICIFVLYFELFFTLVFPSYYYFGRFPDRANIYNEAPYINFIKKKPAYYRVFGIDNILFPNWSCAFQIFDARNIYPLTPERWAKFYQYFFPGGRIGEDTFDRFTGQKADLYKYNENFVRFSQICSIKYFLSLYGQTARSDQSFGNDSDFKNIYNKEINIDELTDVLPRAAIFYDVEIINDNEKILNKLKDKNFDIFKTLILDEPIPENIKESIKKYSKSGNSSAQITEYKTRMVRINAMMDRPGFLMLNDLYYPGWKAYVDGVKTKLYNADYLFRAVYLTQGKHNVVFRYKPVSFLIGSVISMLTFSCSIVLLIIFIKKERENILINRED